MGKGKPRHIPTPTITGIPASGRNIPQPKTFKPSGCEGNLTIRLGHVDVSGPWCLSNIKAPHMVTLLNRIKSLEAMQCSQVFTQGSEIGKIYDVADLPNPEARKRLEYLELDDQTEIARLRITGERRMYGWLPDHGPNFYVLWWDPEHVIWPSKMKHT